MENFAIITMIKALFHSWKNPVFFLSFFFFLLYFFFFFLFLFDLSGKNFVLSQRILRRYSMLFRRPLFHAAVFFFLGELSVAAELSSRLRIFFLFFALLLLFSLFLLSSPAPHGSESMRMLRLFPCSGCPLPSPKKRSSCSGRARVLCLSLLPFLFAVFSYQREARRLSLCRERLSALSDFSLSLSGEVESVRILSGKSRLILKDAVLSSAYGSAEALPKDADPRLRARYFCPAGRLLVYCEGEERLIPGQSVRLRGKLLPERRARNEGEFDFSLYEKTQGLSGSFRAEELSLLRDSASPWQRFLQSGKYFLSDSLSALYPKEELGICKAVLLGESGELDAESRALFRESGAAHLLAISGLHLSILGTSSYEFFRFLGLSHVYAGLFGGILILCYGILAGAHASILRALIMLLLHFLGKAAGRSYDMLSSLSLAFLLLLCFQPFLLFHAGFQLSFAALLPLSLPKGRRSRRLSHSRGQLQMLLSLLLTALSGSLRLSLFLIPLMLWHFFQFPLYGAVLNLFLLPLLPYLLGSILLSLLFYSLVLLLPLPPLSFFASVFSGSGCFILFLWRKLCRLSLSLPFSLITLGRPRAERILLAYLLLFFLGFLRSLPEESGEKGRGDKTSFRFGIVFSIRSLSSLLPASLPSPRAALRKLLSLLSLLFFFLLLLPGRPKGLLISAIDVGQGDGFLLECKGKVMSVDCGSSSNEHFGERVLEPFLLSKAVLTIDTALITHCDRDHLSGIEYLLSKSTQIRIRELVLPAPAEEDPRYGILKRLAVRRGCRIRYLKNGDMLAFPSSLRCCYPENNEPIEEANSHSIGMLLAYGNFRMLFTGDMPEEAEKKLLKNLRAAGALCDIDILKAAHHGSKYSSSEELLDSLRPEYALLSYGRGNRYGHPHRETLSRLEERDILPLKTGELGEIQIQSDGKRFHILAPFSEG